MAAHSCTSGLSILVADDDPINRRLAAMMLGRAGHTVRLAGGGREALEALSCSAYDLVLLDMNMPDLDGPETARRIRALASGTGLPILAITGYDGEEENRVCLEAGMDGVIVKPLTLEALKPWLPASPNR